MYFELPALTDILPSKYLHNFEYLIEILQLITVKVITKQDLDSILEKIILYLFDVMKDVSRASLLVFRVIIAQDI